jgi:hypothetical protein
MNKTIVLAAIAALSAPVAVSAQAQATAAAAPARSGMVTVKVNGLVCDFCVQALTAPSARKRRWTPSMSICRPRKST